jgi:hypothetical protein
MTISYGAYALHAAYLRLQTHTQNVLYFLFFHCNSGRTIAFVVELGKNRIPELAPLLVFIENFA